MSRARTTAGLLALIALSVWYWTATPVLPQLRTAPVLMASGNVDSAELSSDAVAPIALKTAAGPNIATAPAFHNGATTAAGVPVPLPMAINDRLDAPAARALIWRYRAAHQCLATRQSEHFFENWLRDTGTAWLDASERERVLAGRRAAVERMLDACQRQGFKKAGEEFDDEPPGYLLWAKASAAASGDPLARLLEYGRPGYRQEVPSLLTQLVAEGDPTLLVEVGQIHRNRGDLRIPGIELSGRWGGRPDPRMVWALVACDLGMDCGGTSSYLDQLCLREGWCGYPNVEAALRDGGIQADAAVETEVQRQMLRAQVRRKAVVFEKRG